MRLLQLFLFILLLSSLVVAQQRYIVSPSNEMIPLGKNQSGTQEIAKRLSGTTANCTGQATFGYTVENYYLRPDAYRVDFGGYHKDVIGQWFTAPVSGTIDTLFWYNNGSNGALDSLVLVRILQSNIRKGFGPGDNNLVGGHYRAPCQSWGYFVNTNDADQGVAAFPDDANPQPAIWKSTYAFSTGPGDTAAPPFGSGIWGYGGFPKKHRPGTNFVAMSELGECPITKDQSFFISMAVNSENAHKDDGVTGPRTSWSGVGLYVTSTAEELYPSPIWKFYEHDSGPSNCSGIPVEQIKRGWVARGGFRATPEEPDSLDIAVFNWWYIVTATTNIPPTINSVEGGDVHNTFSTDAQHVQYEVYDCDPSSIGADPGLKSVVIEWWTSPITAPSTDPAKQSDLTLTASGGDLWEGDIPGQTYGTYVQYRIKATDNKDMVSYSPMNAYRVVSLANPFYRVDTNYTLVKKAIHDAPSIPPASFFNPAYTGHGLYPMDDGTAGPFPLGQPMVFFGDTVNYAWIGVNGAMALSKTADDTIHVNANGFANTYWNFPYTQHHGPADTVNTNEMPPNFLAPFWADFILADTNGPIGQATIRHGNGGNECQFIAEWDSMGTFDDLGSTSDITTFRVILNMCDGTVEYQYDNAGIGGQDSVCLIGMQADSSAKSGPNPGYVYVHSYLYPYETKPRDDWGIKFYPGAQYFATAGWNMVSVATQPATYQKSMIYSQTASEAFTYAGSYQPRDPLQNGPGYWIKFKNATLAGVGGLPLNSVSIPVNTGWNMIGSISTPVATSSITGNSIVTSPYFDYAGGYNPSSTIEPGKAYWVKTNAAGTLGLSNTESQPKVTPVNELASAAKFTISAGTGSEQSLYLVDGQSLKNTLSYYELPPAAPEFDARFHSGRMVETYSATSTAKTEYVVDVQTDAKSVVVRWENVSSDRKMVLANSTGGRIAAMEGTGTVTVKLTAGQKLIVRLNDNASVPKVFALSQNYPNPFNPVTHFTVDVPRTTQVDVAVYDLLGRKITSLMHGDQEAASYQMEWDGRDAQGLSVPTGIYFIRMAADEFTATQKIMLMK